MSGCPDALQEKFDRIQRRRRKYCELCRVSRTCFYMALFIGVLVALLMLATTPEDVIALEGVLRSFAPAAA